MKIKINDQVIITAGKDKNKKGVVKQVYPKLGKALVEGINLVVKHRKPMMGKPGERVNIEKPLDVSKMAVLNEQGKPDRLGYQLLKDGSKIRIYKKSGKPVDSTAHNPKK